MYTAKVVVLRDIVIPRKSLCLTPPNLVWGSNVIQGLGLVYSMEPSHTVSFVNPPFDIRTVVCSVGSTDHAIALFGFLPLLVFLRALPPTTHVKYGNKLNRKIT